MCQEHIVSSCVYKSNGWLGLGLVGWLGLGLDYLKTNRQVSEIRRVLELVNLSGGFFAP